MVEEYSTVDGIELDKKRAAQKILLWILEGAPGIESGGDLEEKISANFNMLYPGELLATAKEMVRNYVTKDIHPDLLVGKKRRHLSNIFDSELYKNKLAAFSDPDFQILDKSLSKGILPYRELFVRKFGEYADVAMKGLGVFVNSGETRKCGLSTAKHPARASAMAEHTGYDKASGKSRHYYVTLWLIHDILEDGIYSIKAETGEIKYGLSGIDRFLKDFVPEEMQEDLMMITNRSDMILKYIDAKGYIIKTKKDLENALKDLHDDHDISNKYVQEGITYMMELLNEINVTEGKNFFVDIKWEFYNRKFINRLGEQAHEKKHLALLKGKLECDLIDNLAGIKSGSLPEEIRSILKVSLCAEKSLEILNRIGDKNTWSFYESDMYRTAMEALNFANYEARKLLIDDFISKPLEPINQLEALLLAATQLKPVLLTR